MASPGRKHSDLEREERILFLLELRSKGVKATSDLFQFFSGKYPGLTKRQFEYDLAEAKEQIREYYEKDVEFEVSEIAKHLWELYSKSFRLQDYRECRALLREIADLKGLKVQKVEHSGSIKTTYSDLTEEEIQERLERIRNRP